MFMLVGPQGISPITALKSEVRNVGFLNSKIVRLVDLLTLDPKYVLALDEKVLEPEGSSFGNRPEKIKSNHNIDFGGCRLFSPTPPLIESLILILIDFQILKCVFARETKILNILLLFTKLVLSSMNMSKKAKIFFFICFSKVSEQTKA